MARSSPALQFYLGIAWLSLPGNWWLAFEMYVLTLAYGGPLMLFFGIAHTAPEAAMLLSLSMWITPVWFLLTIAGVVLPAYRRALGVSRPVLIRVALAVGFQIALFATYPFWSAMVVLRVVMCLVGLAIVLAMTVLALSAVLKSAALGTASARS